jgi:hypothetical protein
VCEGGDRRHTDNYSSWVDIYPALGLPRRNGTLACQAQWIQQATTGPIGIPISLAVAD